MTVFTKFFCDIMVFSTPPPHPHQCPPHLGAHQPDFKDLFGIYCSCQIVIVVIIFHVCIV